jgi:hypothetical protein
MIKTFGLLSIVGIGMMLVYSGVLFDVEEEAEPIVIDSLESLWTNTQFTFGNMGYVKSVCNKNILNSDGLFQVHASCERTTRISGIASSGILSTNSDELDLLSTCHTRDLKSDEAKAFNLNFNEEAFNATLMDLCQDQRVCDAVISSEVFL